MILSHIKTRNYEEAYKLIKVEGLDKYFDAILAEAFEEADICYYEFIKYVIEYYNNSAINHNRASIIMTNALNVLPKGYEIGFDHAKKSIELEPNDYSYKEYLLLFYQIPNKLLSKDEAIKIANEILKVDQENKAAKLVLSG